MNADCHFRYRVMGWIAAVAVLISVVLLGMALASGWVTLEPVREAGWRCWRLNTYTWFCTNYPQGETFGMTP